MARTVGGAPGTGPGALQAPLRLGAGRGSGRVAKVSEDGAGRLCEIVEYATRHAVAVLRDRGVPRRGVPLGRASLARLDACALAPADALALIPGVDARAADVGFGNWSCRWHSTTSDLSILLRFDRGQQLTAEDGQPRRFGDYQGYVQPEGDGEHTCVVRTVFRSYQDPDEAGDQAVELLMLVVEGKDGTDRLCGFATGLAEDTGAALP